MTVIVMQINFLLTLAPLDPQPTHKLRSVTARRPDSLLVSIGGIIPYCRQFVLLYRLTGDRTSFGEGSG